MECYPVMCLECGYVWTACLEDPATPEDMLECPECHEQNSIAFPDKEIT